MDTIKHCLVLIQILPTPYEMKHRIKARNIAVCFGIYGILLIALISSAIMFFKYLSDDLDIALHALNQIGVYICAIYLMVIGYKQRHIIEKLFVELEIIRNECKFSSLFFV